MMLSFVRTLRSSLGFSRGWRLLTLAFRVCLLHGFAAVFTEAVFHDATGFQWGWVYALFEFLFYAIVLPVFNWNNPGFWFGMSEARQAIVRATQRIHYNRKHGDGELSTDGGRSSFISSISGENLRQDVFPQLDVRTSTREDEEVLGRDRRRTGSNSKNVRRRKSKNKRGMSIDKRKKTGVAVERPEKPSSESTTALSSAIKDIATVGKSTAKTRSHDVAKAFHYESALLSGVLVMISHGSGLAATAHVGFIFGMLCKSAKVPLILLMGRWHACFAFDERRTNRGKVDDASNAKKNINAHQLTYKEVLGSLCVFAGLAIFGIGEQFESPRFSTTGVVLMGLNLSVASYGANSQQSILQGTREPESAAPLSACKNVETAIGDHRVTTATDETKKKTGGRTMMNVNVSDHVKLPREDLLMMIQYCVALLLLVVYTLLLGELQVAMAWYTKACTQQSFLGFSVPSNEVVARIIAFFGETIFDSTSDLSASDNIEIGVTISLGNKVLLLAILDNFLSFIGIRDIFKITREFDAARANAICGCRKLFTFALSYFIFPKAFGRFHAIGLALTAVGASSLHVGAESRRRSSAGKQK
ncbi:unnamed protein product [Amoebophrya sp. A25]|nr:unnamed protein product [Amoebophrya sp. A25]|eukprot:GSA25T00007616001.1